MTSEDLECITGAWAAFSKANHSRDILMVPNDSSRIVSGYLLPYANRNESLLLFASDCEYLGKPNAAQNKCGKQRSVDVRVVRGFGLMDRK